MGAKMDTTKVAGTKKDHKVLMYAISTCAWCKMTKKYLKDNKVEYEYIDVDLCSDKDRQAIRNDIVKRGGEPNYPIIIVDDKIMINGFRKDRINEALNL
jgi:glutaredoxin-like protein NrdH